MAGEISVGELADAWKTGEATIIDVREPFEYEAVHIPGAALVPLSDVPGRHEELPRDRPVYVVCAVGGRSFQAAQFLSFQGVEAINVDGGTDAWVRAGLPVAAGLTPGGTSESPDVPHE